MKLLMLKGLPASGKSTHARELTKEGWVRVNKDELRLMMRPFKFQPKFEKQIVLYRDVITMNALEAGFNVVIDDTNFHPSHEERLREIAKQYKAEFEVMTFDVDVEECIARDLKRGEKAVGEQVIRKMWREYVEPVQELKLCSGPKAVIFDIDGTLARMKDRGPFDWDKVGNDDPVEGVIEMVPMFRASGYKVLIFSGRDGSCFEDTVEWLKKHGVEYDEFAMRSEGDNRKDSVIKDELYEHFRDRYRITHVVDDRPQVCRMWHTKGLTLLKVGDPDLEF
jgi:predicted kinase